jgi:tetratricopeptide (TPR) repeat protein
MRRSSTFGFLPLIVCVASSLAAGQTYTVEGANHYVAAKNWNGLLRYSKAWTASEPDNPTAWYYLGNTYAVGLQDYSDASPAFERAATLKPQWGSAWNALGCTYAQRNLFTRAAPAFQRAVDVDSRSPVYWNNLAATYSQMKKFQTAIDLLNRAITYSGPYANAHNWYIFGNSYSNLKQYPKAIAAYNKALAMNTRFAEAYNNRGVAEEQSGKWDAALADYRRAMGLGDGLASKNLQNLDEAMESGGGGGGGGGGFGSSASATAAALRMAKTQEYAASHPGMSHSEAAYRVQQGGY